MDVRKIMKTIVGWILICIGILCVYMNILHVFHEEYVSFEVNQAGVERLEWEDDILIEDELIPGGSAKKTDKIITNKQMIQLGAMVLTSVGIYIHNKEKNKEKNMFLEYYDIMKEQNATKEW